MSYNKALFKKMSDLGIQEKHFPALLKGKPYILGNQTIVRIVDGKLTQRSYQARQPFIAELTSYRRQGIPLSKPGLSALHESGFKLSRQERKRIGLK